MRKITGRARTPDTTVLLHMYRVSQNKRGPFLKLVEFLYLSKNQSEILSGSSKIILLCSGKDFIYTSTSTGSDVIMTSNCIYDIIFFFICTVENINDI